MSSKSSWVRSRTRRMPGRKAPGGRARRPRAPPACRTASPLNFFVALGLVTVHRCKSRPGWFCGQLKERAMNRTRRFFGVVFGVLFCFLTGHVVRHVVHGQVPQVHLEGLGPQKGRLKENPDGQSFHGSASPARAESPPRGGLGFVAARFFAWG